MSTLKIEDLFGVKGYVALVTGGSSGIGFMISKVRYPRIRLSNLWLASNVIRSTLTLNW
jgi:hypothetical protein